MAKIWNPKKNIPLYTRSNFKCTWQTIIKEPYPGLIIGTGFLSPSWINARRHNEKEYQRCIIHHWPASLVPSNISRNDKLAEIVPAFLDLLKNLGQDDLQKQLIGDAGNFLHKSFNFLTQGPLKDLPLIDFLNPDNSLTFIYANWYEGTPTNLHWVMDFNWTRITRINLQNEQLHQLEDAPEQLSIESFPEISATEIGDMSFVSLPERILEMSSEGGVNFLSAAVNEELSTARGIFEIRASIDNGHYVLVHASSKQELLLLKSGHLNLKRLPEFVQGSLVEVDGLKVVNNLPIVNNEPLFTLFVDSLSVLKTGNETHYPAIEITEDLLEAEESIETVEMFGRTCSTDIRKKISSETKAIEAAAKRLKKINWKKFGTISSMVGGLIYATISAAISVATTAGLGASVGATLLFAKVTALYQATSMLSTLDNSAKKDLKIMNKAKDNLKSLKRKHPECFG